MIVDVHHHYAPRALIETVARTRPELAASVSGLAAGLEQRLTDMDDCGIDVAMLSVPQPGLLGPEDDNTDYAGLARQCNDELVAVAERYPGRFGVLAMLPLADPAASIAELSRIARHDHVGGIIAFAATSRWTLDRPELEPVYRETARLEMPILVHPALDDLSAHPVFGDFGLWASLAPMVETSAAVARIMLSGMLDRVPGLTLIVPHLGGVLPYLAQRLVDQSGTGAAEQNCLEYLRSRCLLDSCSFHRPALACAVDTVSADRIMLGSDYPYRRPLARAVSDIHDSGLDEDARAAILGLTAIKQRLVREPARLSPAHGRADGAAELLGDLECRAGPAHPPGARTPAAGRPPSPSPGTGERFFGVERPDDGTEVLVLRREDAPSHHSNASSGASVRSRSSHRNAAASAPSAIR
jgi:predicted TIM-barrel fold metal-dependent hydrolase